MNINIFTHLVSAAEALLYDLSYHMDTVELCDQNDHVHGVDYHQRMVNAIWKQYKALIPIMEHHSKRRDAPPETTNRWRKLLTLEYRLAEDLAMSMGGYDDWYYVLDSLDPFDNGIRDTDYLDPTDEDTELEDDTPF